MGFVAIGIVAGLLYRPLLVPWLLASSLFIVNYFVSMLFMNAALKLQTGAAAGIAVMSLLLRFGLLGLALLAVALTVPEQFVATSICFLGVYTISLALEIFLGVRSRTVTRPPAAGGGA